MEKQMIAPEIIAQETARILLDTQSILFSTNPPFNYTSGRTGPVYVDCRRLISFPEERTKLMNFAADTIKTYAQETDIIAGGETAGIPYAAFIADRLNIPMVYVRKKPKGFGRNAQIEGVISDKNKRVLITEDIQNYGVSIKIFVDALRAADVIVDTVFVLFTYGHESSKKAMADMGIKTISLCDWNAVLKLARQEKRFEESLLNSIELFLKDPIDWSVTHGGSK
jgi:orotate phosphoribosyltransferase